MADRTNVGSAIVDDTFKKQGLAIIMFRIVENVYGGDDVPAKVVVFVGPAPRPTKMFPYQSKPMLKLLFNNNHNNVPCFKKRLGVTMMVMNQSVTPLHVC